MLARDGPRGEPIATPSICRCIILIKLNSTEEVAVCISSTKTARGKGGRVSSPSYRALAQMSMVSVAFLLMFHSQILRSFALTGHLSSHSALSSYGLFASLALWQFSVSLRPLVQDLGSCLDSGASWSFAINPSLGRCRIATTTPAKLKLQMHSFVTIRVSKLRRS